MAFFMRVRYARQPYGPEGIVNLEMYSILASDYRLIMHYGNQ